jgi:hypothetical protein
MENSSEAHCMHSRGDKVFECECFQATSASVVWKEDKESGIGLICGYSTDKRSWMRSLNWSEFRSKILQAS